MFGFRKTLNELAPADLAAMMKAGSVTLIDVRKPGEFWDGHIAGAINQPLSRFDPRALPQDGRRIVLYCAAGGRSATALGRCTGGRNDVNTHLAGGISAWRRAGLPVTR